MQSQIECRLQVPNGEEISRVLCSNVRVNMPSASISNNAINFDGVAVVQVVYETASGTIDAMDYTLEYKDRYVTNSEMMLSDVIVSVDVVDTKAYIENGNVRVVAILSVTIDGIMADSHNMVVATTGDNVYTKYEDVSYSSYVGLASEKFDLTCDIEIKDAVSKILYVCPKASIDRVESNDNYVKVYGSIDTNITYLTSGENVDIRTCENVTDFTQEIALTGIDKDSYVTSNISCVYQGMTITTDLGADKSILSVTMPVEYKGYVWSDREIQMVSDMYSPDCYIDLMGNSMVSQHHQSPISFVERISGSYTLDDNMLAIDEILGTTCNNVVVANHRLEDGVLVVDGLATTTVIYKNYEMKRMESVEIQLPFSVDLMIGDVKEDTSINIITNMCKVQAKARRGTDIELSADIVLYVEISDNSVDRIICEARVSSEAKVLDSNLMIYVVKEGDTIWDIAKEMSVSEECILAQNPKLELPIQAGERVVIYRQSLARI